MTRRATHRTKVAGVTLDLPIHLDPDTTEGLASQVTQRVREIEASSTRIDTQAFALTAAVTFAAELAQTKTDNDRSIAEVIKALSAILGKLDDLIETCQKPRPPSAP